MNGDTTAVAESPLEPAELFDDLVGRGMVGVTGQKVDRTMAA